MKKEDTQVKFALQGIKTEQFAIFQDNYVTKKETGLGTELQFKFDLKNQKIGVFIGFDFFQGNKVFLKIQVSCHFKIEEKSWENFIRKEESNVVVPKGLLAHLAMISTGTTRGVLFAKTESTIFSKFIIPTLNIAEIIKEDAIIDLIIE